MILKYLVFTRDDRIGVVRILSYYNVEGHLEKESVLRRRKARTAK